MNLHSPGPWCVAKDGVTVKQRKAHAQTICRAREVFMNRSEREANARLIAEAPEMLRLLRDAYSALRSSAGPEEVGNVQREISALILRV